MLPAIQTASRCDGRDGYNLCSFHGGTTVRKPCRAKSVQLRSKRAASRGRPVRTAIAAGFKGRADISFYLRSLLSGHHDTLAVKVE